ncbi:MAG: D-tyrosyl-tRNA(Tyr) deacylase [Gammaproteobacteria bacterium HGW-Gammaproteobacteria-14]|nr:MAG: D-tyrosyl-tRNA(Tyr) deacylase [Gammaproteobacteria bacterium HGW-Gammaproteobacteria-14]
MKLLLQRVRQASVSVEGRVVGEIDQGLLVFAGIEKKDTQALAERLLERLLNYRVFADTAGKMNLSVRDIQGGVLLVSQFTLAADTRSGLRPGFSVAAEPALAEQLYQQMLAQLSKESDIVVASGVFAADMQVSLINDGPVTFLLEA